MNAVEMEDDLASLEKGTHSRSNPVHAKTTGDPCLEFFTTELRRRSDSAAKVLCTTSCEAETAMSDP